MKLDQFIEAVRTRARCEDRLNINSERSYLGVASRFWDWCRTCRETTNEARVTGFLSAHAEQWSASSQRVALNALVFTFKAIGKPLGTLPAWVAAKRPRHLPEWLTDREVRAVLAHLTGEDHLACALMYGSGMRRHEAATLRIRDINLEQGCIMVRCSKGEKDRAVCLPIVLLRDLETQIVRAKAIWAEDKERHRGGVYVHPSVEHKQPSASSELGYFWIFPARNLSRDPQSGAVRRHHLHVESIASGLRIAARRSGITRRVTCHALRHSYACECLLRGMPVHELRELMGHASLATTQGYLHVLPSLASRVGSPLDRPASNIVPMIAVEQVRRLA